MLTRGAEKEGDETQRASSALRTRICCWSCILSARFSSASWVRAAASLSRASTREAKSEEEAEGCGPGAAESTSVRATGGEGGADGGGAAGSGAAARGAGAAGAAGAAASGGGGACTGAGWATGAAGCCCTGTGAGTGATGAGAGAATTGCGAGGAPITSAGAAGATGFLSCAGWGTGAETAAAGAGGGGSAGSGAGLGGAGGVIGLSGSGRGNWDRFTTGVLASFAPPSMDTGSTGTLSCGGAAFSCGAGLPAEVLLADSLRACPSSAAAFFAADGFAELTTGAASKARDAAGAALRWGVRASFAIALNGSGSPRCCILWAGADTQSALCVHACA